MYIEKVDFPAKPIDASYFSTGDVFKDPEDGSYVMLIDYPYKSDMQYGVDLSTGVVYHWKKNEEYPVYEVTPVLAVDV